MSHHSGWSPVAPMSWVTRSFTTVQFLCSSLSVRTCGKSAAFRRGAKLEPLSTPLQDGFRLFHPPIPAHLWARLTGRFPSRETYGVAMFHFSNIEWVRRALSTGSPVAPDKALQRPCADSVAFWLKPFSTFGLLRLTMFIKRSPGFAIPPILAPSPSGC
jgi:hypothetical protein